MLTTNSQYQSVADQLAGKGLMDGGGASDTLQERHLRKQFLAGSLSEADEKIYRQRFGDPRENAARETARDKEYLEELRQRRQANGNK